jgi:hypothetical protein
MADVGAVRDACTLTVLERWLGVRRALDKNESAELTTVAVVGDIQDSA